MRRLQAMKQPQAARDGKGAQPSPPGRRGLSPTALRCPCLRGGMHNFMNNLLCPIGWLTNSWKFMLSSASIDKLATNG